MTFSQIFKLTTLLTIVATAVPAFAQSTTTYRLPGQHTEQSGQYLANQKNISSTISVKPDVNVFNFDDEEEPEDDIYELGWDSNRVNCYANVDVPQTAVIDVSKFSMPHPGGVTSPYGYRPRFRRMHKGIDLKVNIGDTIRAAFDGRVRITNYERKGYGYYVVLRHTNDLETVYGHLSKFLVKNDQYVKAGDPIALGGNTGRSTGPHLHFETRYMGYAINPMAIFDFANQTTHTDTYTFDKNTYQRARNYDPAANAAYAAAYNKQNPPKRSSATASSSGAKYVTVKKGDTLSKIASRNGTTTAAICKLNSGLKASTTLALGRKLRVK